MEPEAVKRSRGRKRKRKNEKSVVEKSAKKGAGKSSVLVGRYVKKEFDESGEFLGKIVSYDAGLYRVDYEDGDCEDLETLEVKGFLVEDGDMDAAFHKRRKALDGFITRKYNKLKAAQAQVEVQAQSVENVVSVDKVETVNNESVELVNGDKVEVEVEAEVDNEMSSDFSDDEPSVDVVEVEIPLPPPPELPPSSGNIAVPEEHVSHLLSVYSFLRSFSVCLFLSPFGIDEFVGALNSTVHNTLLDSIHVALVRTLKSHVENLSSEGSEVAAKCLRSMDWSLLDSLTWPMFIVQYLTSMRYAEGPEWKEFYVTVLEKDYYTLSAGRKLTVLQILCDDASNSAELRAEIDNREESEFGLDPDRVVTPVEIIPKANEIAPRKGRPRKNPVSYDEEDVSESHKKAISSAPNAVVSKPTKGADVDEDGNGDECRLCGMDGTLICCDGCPSSYHSRCIGVMKMFIPQGDWYCPECTINRNGPKVTNTTSLRGAEFFGIDPYEQVFLGSCDHLLVVKTSRSLELHVRYYSPVDVLNVVNALTCSAEHMALYMEICKGILQYWEIPEHVFSLAKVEIDEKFPNKEGEQSTPSTLMDKGGDNVADAINNGNVDGVGELSLKDAVVTLPEEKCNALVEVKDSHQPYQQVVENKTHLGNSTNLAVVKVEPSSLSGNLSVNESAVCISENGNCNNESNMAYYTKQATLLFGGRGAGGWLYNGSSFKAQAYANAYVHGDFAASAAASLAILSSEEKPASQAETSIKSSINYRKFMSANYTLQAKAFALAAKRFYWPNYERKLFEVPRERCGWCVACQANINSRRGCYLNSAFSNAIKGAAKILSAMQSSKNAEGSLASIATYVLFMEESLRGLTVGPFVTVNYRNQWRKLVEEATTLKEIKAFLLDFERSIRDIAFSADWIRLVDDASVENQATQNAKTVVGSTQKRGQGRRGRKQPVVIPEVTETDGKDSSSDIAWWRGGLLSKHIFQKGVLPQKMLKHAARQGGCAIINSVQYIDGLEVPKRSRQFIWRAAVDMSKTASQLALQVRYLDLHVRWNELVCPEQPSQDGKGSEAEASAFRNACIVDKKIVGNKISYGVIFENQKYLPSRVMKRVLEVEETEDKKEKNWFVEMHIPLYLIKDYEKKVAKTVMPSPAKHVSELSSLGRKKFKAPGKSIFSFLVQKRDNLGKCLCTSCQLDVSFRVSAKCSACQGYCHEQCAVGSRTQTAAGKIELITTCKKCYVEKVATPKREIVGDSPTSPLLLQGQESQQPTKIVFKLGKQSSFQKPIEYTNQSSQKKNPPSNLSTKSKSGKKIDQKRHLTGPGYQSYEKKPKKKINPNGSISNSKASKYCLGLIWKKRNLRDTGTDFRLRNILMKNNPNGHLLAPKCQLYWFHADSVELQESKIMELFGFKCSRCRRIRIPICPYTDPEERKKLESRKAALEKAAKGRYMDTDDSDLDSNDDLDSEPDSAQAFGSMEAGDVQEENPYDSYLMADQVNYQRLEMDFEPPFSGTGPVSKKLAVRRHIKSEKESDGISENNPACDLPANNLNSAAGESSTPIVEWNVSTNGFEDNMMFDYGDLNYEDMEFEPQTYFSFNELLVADDGVQTDKGDPNPSGDMTEKVVNPSAPSIDDPNPGQFQMDVSYDQQEPMFSIESGLEMVPCRVCSQADPIPDLFCQTCGLWLHQHCSPWEEDDSSWDPETGWKAAHGARGGGQIRWSVVVKLWVSGRFGVRILKCPIVYG
ncbi:DDT domain-containing protein PTM [Tanacetum coccineum]